MTTVEIAIGTLLEVMGFLHNILQEIDLVSHGFIALFLCKSVFWRKYKRNKQKNTWINYSSKFLMNQPFKQISNESTIDRYAEITFYKFLYM